MVDFLKKQLILDIQEASMISDLNTELLDNLIYSTRWIIDYSIRNNIPLENLDKLQRLLKTSRTLIQQMNLHEPPKNQHPDKTPKEPTKPNIFL